MLKKLLSRSWTLIKHSGTKYICPICKYKAGSFKAAGLYVKRPNEKCPSCGSLTRHRHMWLFLEEYLKDKKEIDILHFAPEKPIAEKLKIKKNLRYFTSQYDVETDADFHINLENIDLKDKSFDLVICSHVLEHVKDDNKAISEIRRILRPEGLALIQVPLWPSESHATYENPAVTDPRDRIIHFGQFDHLRIYGLDVKERLEIAGFKVEIIDLAASLSSQVVDKLRLQNTLGIRELIFYSRKLGE